MQLNMIPELKILNSNSEWDTLKYKKIVQSELAQLVRFLMVDGPPRF